MAFLRAAFLLTIAIVAVGGALVYALPGLAFWNDSAETMELRLSPPDIPAPPPDAKIAAAFAALEQRDYGVVRSAIDNDQLAMSDRNALTWAFAHSGGMRLSELRAARETLETWPGDDALQSMEDREVARGLFSFMQLQRHLGDRVPADFSVAVALARNYAKSGDSERVRELLLPFWISEGLRGADELSVLEEFSDVLTPEDHARRYFHMMACDRIRSGERLKVAAKMEPVHDAWTAVIRGQSRANALLEAVPETHNTTTAYKFARVEHLRRQQRYDEAAALLATVSTDPSIAINPDAWWNERRIVSRSLREAGELTTAYEIASAHIGGTEQTQIAAAFHAGWYALQSTQLDQAKTHFEAVVRLAQTPISRARGFYWLGRAHEADGDDEAAREAYRDASEFDTTFYSFLAAEKSGAHSELGNSDRSERPEFIKALQLFDAVERPDLIRRFSETLRRDQELIAAYAPISDWLNPRGYYFEAVRLAKAAHRIDNRPINALHPLQPIPADAFSRPEHRALSLAIARQESEFRADARSSANALGLMQLLPATAQATARSIGVGYNRANLLEDPGYNAQLGFAYIDDQLRRFDGSYVLALVAYNAGPGRAGEWVDRFGSPIGLSLNEAIDWIEQIPFPETRNYMFRVLENYAVYRRKLGVEKPLSQLITQGHSSD